MKKTTQSKDFETNKLLLSLLNKGFIVKGIRYSNYEEKTPQNFDGVKIHNIVENYTVELEMKSEV